MVFDLMNSTYQRGPNGNRWHISFSDIGFWSFFGHLYPSCTHLLVSSVFTHTFFLYQDIFFSSGQYFPSFHSHCVYGRVLFRSYFPSFFLCYKWSCISIYTLGVLLLLILFYIYLYWALGSGYYLCIFVWVSGLIHAF